MWRFLSLTALLLVSLTGSVPRSRADDAPFLVNYVQRRSMPGGQPPRRAPQSTLVPGGVTKKSVRTTKTFSAPEARERSGNSDWEIVQALMEGESFPFHWQTHRGTPEECVALIQVRTPEGLQSFNALVVRCDGFLMAPQAVWDALKERLPVEVRVTQAEGEPSVGPFPILARNPHKSRLRDYHFVKVNDHHLRCLPALASWNLAKGTPLRVVWATLADDGKTLIIKSVPATCEQPPTDRALNDCGLSFPPGQRPTRVPNGAVVIDAQSQAAVGMIPDGNQPTSFATTRHFGDLCADVALAPTRDAALGKDPTQTAGSTMVKVPGGPVIYDNKEFVATYRTAIACTPDFYCDKYLVTIEDWQGFLDFRRDRPWPEGWDKRNRNNPPTNYPKLPILDATAGDMQDFAAWRNKRLITAVEWVRAAQTSRFDWLERVEREATALQAELQRAQTAFQEATLNRVAFLEQQFSVRAVGGRPPRGETTVEGSMGDITADYIKILRQIQKDHAAFLGSLPGQPCAVGSRAEDHSDWGIFDINLNAPEACLGWGKNFGFTPKQLPAGQDPFTSTINSVGSYADPGSGLGVSALRGTLASVASDDPVIWAGIITSQFGGAYHDQPMVYKISPSPDRPRIRMGEGFYHLDIKARSGLAFRCAL